MEVYCVKVEYEGACVSGNYTSYILWSTIDGAKESLKKERGYILEHNRWLNNENCIKNDEEDHFCTHDDEDYYEITISKEKVHE